MIKNCKVCGGEMDCYNTKGRRNWMGSLTKTRKLPFNRVTCSRSCSRENLKMWARAYSQIPEVKKRLSEYGKKYRQRKRDEKKAMQKDMV